MALHARGANQQKSEEAGWPQPGQKATTERNLSLRAILLILALVPSTALVALGALNSAQLYSDWNSVNDRNEAGKRLGAPIVTVFYQLQVERQLSAAALAAPKATASALAKQRELTDRSVQSFEALSDTMPVALTKSFQQVGKGLAQLPEYRDAVDQRTADQQQTFDNYTDVIASDMQLFEDFANVGFANVGFGDVTIQAEPALNAQWGLEMLSRESAIFTAGAAKGHLTDAQRSQLAEVIGSQQYIFTEKVVSRLPGEYAKAYQDVLSSAAWKQKTRIEQEVLTAGGTEQETLAADGTEQEVLTADSTEQDGQTPVSAQLGMEWQQSYGALAPQLVQAGSAYTDYLVSSTEDKLDDLMRDLIVDSAVAAAAVLLVFLISLRFTGVLRRRVYALRAAALELQTRLPGLVERLRRGEKVDTDTELPEVRYGNDELGMLGRALNQARASALETAVREVEQYRGFERLLQRIARRTQLLIGMQMNRLGQMQRQNEDPDVLEGLFDLDHLAARLRRYEENLVILGGGQPQRRWRKPVLLLDVLRSAQGEVQDYRRIRIETEDETWLSERAVGPMVHVLAELMENAVSFSKPPTPVEVHASWVGRGVAIEIEDRGVGMDPEQYAEANGLMADPPRMDVMSRSDDARLGLYVVARLSANLGLNVELRPSAYGGTRVVVLVPRELISDERPPTEPPYVSGPAQLTAVGASHSGQDDEPHSSGPAPQLPSHPGNQEAPPRPLIGPWTRSPARSAVTPAASSGPLPRRVRQANLAAELRAPSHAHAEGPRAGTSEPEPSPRLPRRSSATVGAFQRQSRLTRIQPESDQQPTHLSPAHDGDRKEDRR